LMAPLNADKNKKFHDGLAEMARNPQIKGASRLTEIPDAQAVVGTIHVEGDQVKLSLGLDFNSPAQASQTAEIVQGVLTANRASFKAQLGAAALILPPNAKGIIDTLTQLLDSLSTGTEGTQARLTGQLPLTSVQQMLQEAQAMSRQGPPAFV